MIQICSGITSGRVLNGDKLTSVIFVDNEISINYI